MFKEMAHSLGLTRKVRRELSDEIVEEGKVVCREYEPRVPSTGELVLATFYSPIISQMDNFNYVIRVEGKTETFEFRGGEYYDLFKPGDKVEISYRLAYEVTKDYVPPYFDSKNNICRKFKGIVRKKIKPVIPSSETQ